MRNHRWTAVLAIAALALQAPIVAHHLGTQHHPQDPAHGHREFHHHGHGPGQGNEALHSLDEGHPHGPRLAAADRSLHPSIEHRLAIGDRPETRGTLRAPLSVSLEGLSGRTSPAAPDPSRLLGTTQDRPPPRSAVSHPCRQRPPPVS